MNPTQFFLIKGVHKKQDNKKQKMKIKNIHVYIKICITLYFFVGGERKTSEKAVALKHSLDTKIQIYTLANNYLTVFCQ